MTQTSHEEPAQRRALLCLPHAGGSITTFRGWDAALAPDWEVIPLELPGRGARYTEPLPQGQRHAVDSLVPRMAPHSHGPWALFGHSLGALLAFELAHAATRWGRPPSLIVISGRNGPSERSEIPPLHGLGDDELLATLREFGGMPGDSEVSEDLLTLFLPILRTDLRIAETYVRAEREPLGVPVVSLVGRDDRLCSRDRVKAWGRETRAAARVVEHDGGHFAVYEPAFQATLRDVLAAGLQLAGSVRSST